jgi:hypothetical protein
LDGGIVVIEISKVILGMIGESAFQGATMESFYGIRGEEPCMSITWKAYFRTRGPS